MSVAPLSRMQPRSSTQKKAAQLLLYRRKRKEILFQFISHVQTVSFATVLVYALPGEPVSSSAAHPGLKSGIVRMRGLPLIFLTKKGTGFNMKRWFLGALFALLIFAGVTLLWLFLRKPASAAPRDVRVAMSAERIARGRYLFEHALDCSGCHSDRDFTRFGAPVKPEGIGMGVIFPDEMGLPGKIVAPNITPDRETGIGAWTDGEIIRAIREGISRDGSALFPFMPYQGYRQLSDEDVESLVAYMRTLKPIRNELPRTSLALPVALMIKSAPQPVAGPVLAPSPEDTLAYGRYLVTTMGCGDCHTPQEKGHPVAELAYAGGMELRTPAGVVVSANITPHGETGIGSWTEDGFVSRFRQYQEYALNGPPPGSPETFTLMPWLAYSQLEERDLRAIYRYLRTLKPIEHKVQTHPSSALAAR